MKVKKNILVLNSLIEIITQIIKIIFLKINQCNKDLKAGSKEHKSTFNHKLAFFVRITKLEIMKLKMMIKIFKLKFKRFKI